MDRADQAQTNPLLLLFQCLLSRDTAAQRHSSSRRRGAAARFRGSPNSSTRDIKSAHSGLSVDKDAVETVSYPVAESRVGLSLEGFEIVWAHHLARTSA
ncbi:hypothetical protein THPR109532_14085 [Thalassospira profundimaris]